ncbi:MAG: hypothetical protein HY319_01295 [Armatimonadetes bacterium]|nr:hypothetical protein [Armatimonadota bacterium]
MGELREVISPTSRRSGFWQMPPRWVWLLFVGSLTIFTASMITWWEGMRFQSRPLDPAERLIVERSLETWSSLCPEPEDLKAVQELRQLLDQEQLRSMDEKCFGRKAERITLGYTDERGRILLNPHICFSTYYALGEHRTERVHTSDLVRTLTTVFHEFQHREYGASEAEAYEREWAFARRCLERAELASHRELARELRDWEADMAHRVERYVEPSRLEELKGKLSRLPGEG